MLLFPSTHLLYLYSRRYMFATCFSLSAIIRDCAETPTVTQMNMAVCRVHTSLESRRGGGHVEIEFCTQNIATKYNRFAFMCGISPPWKFIGMLKFTSS
jgi:hypothetical protein